VISLHGIGGTPQARANQTYAATLDSRINSGELLPTIWLFPDGQTNSFYGNAYDGHKQVYSNIIHEALPYVDSNYRTIADRSHRAMEGFSMGGFGAAMYTAKHPELFSAIVEYGGALSTWQNLTQFNNAVAQEMYNGVETNFSPFSLWDLTAASAEALRTTVNYKMIVGDADSQYQSNIRFRDRLIALGIDPHFQVLPGVEHQGGSYVSEGSGLRYLSNHFATMFQREGDYTRDGTIDENDYVSWRSTYGSTSQLAADGSVNLKVDAADYVVWRMNATAAASGAAPEHLATSTVPEPGTLVFCGWLLALLATHGQRAARYSFV
jgi:endo-1,4-beta-xylanase